MLKANMKVSASFLAIMEREGWSGREYIMYYEKVSRHTCTLKTPIPRVVKNQTEKNMDSIPTLNPKP